MTKLADLVASEAGIGLAGVMLLRHSSATLEKLRARGGTVEDYTIVQRSGSKYDYRHPSKPPIEVVVVIVGNRVHNVYRILGVEQEGTTYSLESVALRQMNIERQRPPVPARRFRMEQLPSSATGKGVTGWETRQRTTVQRSDSAFFGEIEVDVPDLLQPEEEIRKQLEKGVEQSMRDTSEARRKRLAIAPERPRRFEVRAFAFDRNPDVVAEVLFRAQGTCEMCGSAAPFSRRSDGSPYLEVHHRVRLASGGKDTVENAYGLCPNCHRRAHYG